MKIKSDLWGYPNKTLEKLFIKFKITIIIFVIGISNVLATTTNPTENGLFTEVSGSELQQMVVTGRVTGNNGEALPGVNILIKGTLIGVITDNQGRYSISVNDANAVLVFSFIGYTPQEITVNRRTSIDITLSEELTALDEVVVTALGITREKKALAYAVTEVKGDNFAKAREINLGTALAGRIAGINVTTASTGPTGASRVIIRGNGSISGDNQPLYVINNVPSTSDALISINPDDIENISVLKGGTAAALYGSAASNGVILITTKGGSNRKGIGIELTSTYTGETYTNNTDYQYEYGSGNRGLKPTTIGEALVAGRTSWGAKLDGSPVIQLDGVQRPYSAQKNNFKNFYNIGSNFSNTIAFTAGNESANMRFSVSNMDEKGIVPNVSLNRKTFNLSGNMNLAKKVEFEGRVLYTIQNDKNRTATNDFISNPNGAVALIATSLDVRTLKPGYDENGNQTEWNDYNFVMNPWFAVNKLYNEYSTSRLIGNFTVKYNIIPSLYVSGSLGIDRADNTNFSIGPTGALTSPEGSVSERMSWNYTRNSEVRIGFNKKFDAFNVRILVGGNQKYRPSSSVSLSSGKLNVPFQYFIGNGLTQTFSKNFSESAVNSLYASADIGYKNIFLTLTGRQDWFSTLSPESNTIFYPSAGLSYVLTDGWGSKPAWLDYAKLRGSWAQVGGSTPSPYGLDLTYSAGSTLVNGQPLMSISTNTIPNPLKPLTNTTTEFGFEARLFNKFLADFTLYDRTTTNDIVSASVARSSSYTSSRINIGEMRNRGIELLLTVTPYQNSNGIQWDVSYNMAYNKNKVLKLAPGLDNLSIGGSTRTGNGFVYAYVGQPYGMVAGYPLKKDNSGNNVYDKNTGIPIPGAFKPLGEGVAPWTMGLTNDFKYKRFSASLLIDAKFGNVKYSATNDYAAFFGLDKRTVENNVRETGITVKGVDPNGEPVSKTITAQEYWQGVAFFITEPFVYDASFIKLRSITFGYDIPTSFLSKFHLQSASLNLVGRNLFILYKKVPNIDPESALDDSNGQGTESIGTPNTRNFGLNLTVSF